jgi:hypothetical protein
MALNFCNNNSLSAITALPASISGGGLNLISTQTASSSSSLSFTSGIDSTYKEYIFKFYNMHGSSDGYQLAFQCSTDGGSNYNTTITSTFFNSSHDEADTSTALSYAGSFDLAQGTGFQPITHFIGTDNDQSSAGTLHLFDPSNTTFVKHFIVDTTDYYYNDYNTNNFVAGYCNTTSAINAIQFKMLSGNIDSGVIKLYGVS